VVVRAEWPRGGRSSWTRASRTRLRYLGSGHRSPNEGLCSEGLGVEVQMWRIGVQDNSAAPGGVGFESQTDGEDLLAAPLMLPCPLCAKSSVSVENQAAGHAPSSSLGLAELALLAAQNAPRAGTVALSIDIASDSPRVAQFAGHLAAPLGRWLVSHFGTTRSGHHPTILWWAFGCPCITMPVLLGALESATCNFQRYVRRQLETRGIRVI
jgi:hypothetical protein